MDPGRGVELSFEGRPMGEAASLTIRKFKRDDIGKILEIEEESSPKTAFSREILLEYADFLPDSFVVLEKGEDVVGYSIFDRDGHIHSMAVRSAHRRKGFGSKLFIYALECARQRLWLEVRSKNSGGIAFYKSVGMKLIDRIPRYYENDDALIMRWG